MERGWIIILEKDGQKDNAFAFGGVQKPKVPGMAIG